jgi:tetratricopeptide (TPR) repeat protein/sterol desaturase/sphingolipid hydroxylase (fatty acid hydroxylase superfamily)
MEWIADIGDFWLETLAWIAGLTLAFGILARLMPCNPGMYWWKNLRSAATDFIYWFLMPLFLRLGRTLLLWAGIRLLFGGTEPQPVPVKHLPLWQQCILVLLIQDVLLYLIHRLFHTRLGWKFHAIHHSPTVLDWMSTARFHPINHLLAFTLADVVVLLMGFSAEALLVLTPFNLVYSAMTHANLNWTFGPLRYVLASPVFHRWHHTTEKEGLNKNFASTFPFLDLLFGTFYMPPGKLPEQFGTGENDFPEDFLGQFLHPFSSLSSVHLGKGEEGNKRGILGNSLRKRSGKWRAFIGAALALMIFGGMAFSLVHGQHRKKRDQHLSQGLEHFHRQEYARALDEYTEALRFDPACALVYANRASVYFNQGELEQALADCNRALELDPQLSLAYANRAGVYLNRGELDLAIADCNRALELDPQSSVAFANRGAAYLNKGDFDQAVADCTRALQLDERSALAFANRGAAYFNKGEFDRAIADSSQAVANDPSLAMAYLNRAAAFLAKGDSPGAIADCNQALRLDPTLARAYAVRGAAFFNKGDNLAAIADADEALRRDPKLTFVYGNRGLAHLRLGQIEEALQDFNHALEHEPRLALLYAYRGVVHLHKGDVSQAIADCDRAIELDPKLALAYWNRSLAYARQGDYQHAEADQKKALQLEPSLGQQ